MFNIFRKKKNSKKSTIAQEFIQQEKTTSADNDTEDKKDQHNQASINDKKAINPNRSLETELALFLMTAIRKMWLYIVGS